MAERTRRCVDCKTDISERGRKSIRCSRCQYLHCKPPRLKPRTCLHCGETYQPRGHLQKWCKGCVSSGHDRYRINRYGSLAPTEVELALADGKRTSTCRVCDREFTYRYIGGTPRQFCDDHVPTRVVAERAAAQAKRKICVDCGRDALFVDDSGRCHRHEPDAKVNRDCETCGTTFVMRSNHPRRFCSLSCSYTRRGPMSEARTCELCDHAFFPRHPAQKYCTGCVKTKSDRAIVARYGLSRSGLLALRAKFDDQCWLCRVKPGKYVDHCHATGKVRGWLCPPCNMALHYVERPGWWEGARAYLDG